MGRRDDVIDEAVALLKSDDPGALTSTNVANALGVTQSAIYRHVRDMDELTTLAGRRIVGELSAILESALLDPDIAWGEPGDFHRISGRLAAAIARERSSFRVLDRSRWAPGELGAGVREVLESGVRTIAARIESEWRTIHAVDTPLDATQRALVSTHAELLQDEVISIARNGAHLDEAACAALLELRLRAGWLAFCMDMNRHQQLPMPELSF